MITEQERDTFRTDQDFLSAFEEGALSSQDFRHADHIRMSWLYLRKWPLDQAIQRIINGIRNFASVHGATRLYHETITRFWIYAVKDAIQKNPAESFQEFAEKNGFLMDKNHIFDFYSKEYLLSDRARNSWQEPDLRALTIEESVIHTESQN